MLIFKKTRKPKSDDTKEVSSVKLWFVSWYSRDGEYSHSINKEMEAFVSKSEAEEYASSLKAAFKLVRHTSRNSVTVNSN